jgi:hypothetical protein
LRKLSPSAAVRFDGGSYEAIAPLAVTPLDRAS